MKKYIVVCILVLVIGVFGTAAKFRRDFEPSNSGTAAPHANGNSATKDDQDFESSDGWRITGYFTPIETDYTSGETRTIEIKNLGTEKFDKEFLDTVFDENKGYGEGWGKTRFGWYLGNYNGRWHKATAPLDANNAPLQKNSVAVDNTLIPYDSKVKIPLLPDGFGEMTFIANDVGVTVHGKHIDIYCGEGKDAEQEMYRVTRDEEDDGLVRVYFKKPIQEPVK